MPIPASRDTVPTGYNYVMPDQNGWSRYLHFQAAWAAGAHRHGLRDRQSVEWPLPQDLVPDAAPTRKWRAFREVIAKYLRRAPPDEAEAHSYNVMQRTAYLGVIFVLFPLVIWTASLCRPPSTLRSRSPSTRWAAGNPRAPFISSSPDSLCSS